MTNNKKGPGGIVDDALSAVGLSDDQSQESDPQGQKGGQSSSQGKGWHGDPKGHSDAGKKAAETAEKRHGEDFHETIGAKGGRAAQHSGNAHELTDEERSKGGQS